MQSILLSSASSRTSHLMRWFWHREVKLFLIHYGIWVLVSLLVGWFEFTYLSAEVLQKTSPLTGKYQHDWNGYVTLTLAGDFIYLLPVHLSYWLFRTSLRRGQTWSLVLFGVYIIPVYFLILSLLTGIMEGYFKLAASFQDAMVLAIIVWIYTLTFISVRAYRQNRRQQRELEFQKNQAELSALKAQVNPHFMFNTLNNLYGTALSGDTDRTAAGIEQLSSVMRHITEASQHEFISIEQELRFVEDMVELHRMRLPRTDTIRIRTDIDWDEKPARIVPLLLNPLIENAFKYGISMQQPCFVQTQLRVENNVLYFNIENSVHSRTGLEKGTGLGLVNVRQRLALAYPNRHSLYVREEDNTFSVNLTIDL